MGGSCAGKDYMGQGNHPAAETRTIAAPAPAETNRDEMQQAMDADVTRVGGAYDPDVDFKVHHL